MVRERLMYFLGVEVYAAIEFAAEQQHGNLVAVTAARLGIAIDIDDVDGKVPRLQQQLQGQKHLLAQPAIGPRIQQESRLHAHRRGVSGARARWPRTI